MKPQVESTWGFFYWLRHDDAIRGRTAHTNSSPTSGRASLTPRPQTGRMLGGMTILALILSFLAALYLVAAIAKPEWFS